MTSSHADRIADAVEKYLIRNSNLVPFHHFINRETRQHIIRIGTSIMCTKWEVGPSGGSFVNAICKNDLREAVTRADSINSDCIKFYVTLYENLEYVY